MDRYFSALIFICLLLPCPRICKHFLIETEDSDSDSDSEAQVDIAINSQMLKKKTQFLCNLRYALVDGINNNANFLIKLKDGF